MNSEGCSLYFNALQCLLIQRAQDKPKLHEGGRALVYVQPECPPAFTLPFIAYTPYLPAARLWLLISRFDRHLLKL